MEEWKYSSIGSRWRWVVSFTPLPLLHPKKHSSVPFASQFKKDNTIAWSRDWLLDKLSLNYRATQHAKVITATINKKLPRTILTSVAVLPRLPLPNIIYCSTIHGITTRPSLETFKESRRTELNILNLRKIWLLLKHGRVQSFRTLNYITHTHWECL
jgi:hypothetical protein